MKSLLAGLVMVMTGVLSGCGGGDGQSAGGACTEARNITAKTVEAVVTAAPQGNGVYVILGSAMDGVAGIDLNISYPSSLSSPAITRGALITGAMMVANTNQPGGIKVAIVSSKPFSGGGEIVRITFANQGSGTLSVSASMINASGASVGSASGSSTGSSSTPGIAFTGSSSATAPTSSVTTTLGSVSCP